MKRVKLNISVPEDLRKDIKVAAALIGSTMTEFVEWSMKLAIETVKENRDGIDNIWRQANAGEQATKQDQVSAE